MPQKWKPPCGSRCANTVIHIHMALGTMRKFQNKCNKMPLCYVIQDYLLDSLDLFDLGFTLTFKSVVGVLVDAMGDQTFLRISYQGPSVQGSKVHSIVILQHKVVKTKFKL